MSHFQFKSIWFLLFDWSSIIFRFSGTISLVILKTITSCSTIRYVIDFSDCLEAYELPRAFILRSNRLQEIKDHLFLHQIFLCHFQIKSAQIRQFTQLDKILNTTHKLTSIMSPKLVWLITHATGIFRAALLHGYT